MITPEPESDLRQNIIVLGSEMIKIIREYKDYVVVEDLLNHFIKRNKLRTKRQFFNTFIFLYILGIIEIKNFKVRLKSGYTQQSLF